MHLETSAMRILLISTYEMGRQPLGLASPAAWLRTAGHQVTTLDLARERLSPESVQNADITALFLPMHTATRLALKLIPKLRAINPNTHFCAYGLYAPLNESLLREHGVQTILGGEYEHGLVELAAGRQVPAISLDRQKFQIPDRTGLPLLSTYAQLATIDGPRIAGYTEASRGCKHRCRHCPVVPVYNGTFRVIQREIVMADIRQQVASGATHITFGDPDFFNGPTHAIRIVEDLHREFPNLTWDATIKVEHLLNHREHLQTLHETGCAFVVSAVEFLDDAVLEKLEKGHTREDFIEAAHLMRAAGLPLSPTFIPFTPWTTPESVRDLLRTLAALDLIESVAPIQLGIRLLIPEGSRLLELEEIRKIIGPFDANKLTYPWQHSNPAMDRLSENIQSLAKSKQTRPEQFAKIWDLASCGTLEAPMPSRATIPYLTEPWYC
jgi:radical SAM superfamily enzyme YgiQ (UPF0313 family)